MHIEYKPLANVPTAETLGDTDTVLVVSGGEVKKTAKSNVGGGSGGGLLVETTYVNVSQYEKGFVSDLDADDIVEAFTSGKNVVVHIPKDGSGYVSAEIYVPIAMYVPADEEQSVDEDIEFADTYPNNHSVSWYVGVQRTEQGKFFFKIYID